MEIAVHRMTSRMKVGGEKGQRVNLPRKHTENHGEKKIKNVLLCPCKSVKIRGGDGQGVNLPRKGTEFHR